MLLSEKQKKFSQFFSAFFKSRLGLEHFQKKKIPLIAMFLQNYELRKTWLEKCLKTLASDDPSTSNMVNGTKHC